MGRKKATFYAGKRKKHNGGKYALTSLGALLAVAAVAAIAVFGIGRIRERNEARSAVRAEGYGKYSWSTDKLSGVSEVKTYAGYVFVYKDAETGRKGLIKSDGTVLCGADYDSFTVYNDAWRSERFIATKPGSRYPLVVDAAAGKVTTKQYQGAVEASTVLKWDLSSGAAAWYDALGFAGKVEPGEVVLAPGLYPIEGGGDNTDKWGYLSSTLTLDIPLNYDAACDFSQGLAAVSKGGKWGYIDEKGKQVIAPQYDSVSAFDNNGRLGAFPFANGLVTVKKGETMGIVNREGKILVDFDFSVILPGVNGIYIACRDGKWGIITLDNAAELTEVTSAPAQQGEPALANGDYAVNTSGSPLNMRKSASTQSDILRKIPNGTKLRVSKAVSGWAYVSYRSAEGWVSAEYLISAELATTVATTAAVTTVF